MNRKKTMIIILVVAGIAISIVAIFFAQKYWRLYSDYQEFLAVQQTGYKIDIIEGREPEYKEWTFSKYLQMLKEGEEKGKKIMEEYEAALEAMRQDTVGGKTPEETLFGFVEALKNRDFDLASKYFWLDKQEEWRENLKEIAQKNLLDAMISDLEKASIDWELDPSLSIGEDTIGFRYKFGAEGEKTIIQFRKNIYSEVWKINLL